MPELYPPHPLAELFWTHTPDERRVLAESLQRCGQQQPIWLLDGQVLDGRLRQEVCHELELRPWYATFDPAGGVSPLDFVVAQNLARAHATLAQRALAATQLLPLYEKEAWKRQKAGKKGNLPATVPEGYRAKGEAREHAAAACKVSPRTVSAAARVSKNGTPELVEAVRADRIAVAPAAVIAALPPEEQLEAIQQAEAGAHRLADRHTRADRLRTGRRALEKAREAFGGLDDGEGVVRFIWKAMAAAEGLG